MSKKHQQCSRAEKLARRDMTELTTPKFGQFGRQLTFPKIIAPVSRSKCMPHIGAKEQERAKRCYMIHFHPAWLRAESYDERLFVRSAPVVNQMSKRQYEAQQIAKAA